MTWVVLRKILSNWSAIGLIKLKQIIAWLIYLVAWYTYAVSFMSHVGMVLGVLLLPYFVVAVIETVLGVGFLATVTLAGVLWFVATMGLGLRFCTWRALYFAALPGGLWAAISIIVVFYQLGETSV